MFLCRACLHRLTAPGVAPMATMTAAGRTGLGRGRIQMTATRLPLRPLRAAQLISSARSYTTPSGDPAASIPPLDAFVSPPEERHIIEGPGRGDGSGDAAKDTREASKEKTAPPSSSKQPRDRIEQLEKTKHAVEKRLVRISDPFHIAKDVLATLQRGRGEVDYDEALLMVRRASRTMKTVVAWNHLIEYQLKRSRIHAAIKLYNEMKKRGQVPNALTYTVMFRGLARTDHPQLAVAETLRLYNYMLNQGPIRPNTVHLNAAIYVCARAHDLEGIFTVLASANEKERVPDRFTYTTILDVLRSPDKSNQDGLTQEEQERDMKINLDKGREIWAQVMARWKKGLLMMDEELVTSMGWLLTQGSYQDNLDVLALVSTTMNIPTLEQMRNPSASPKVEEVAAQPPALKQFGPIVPGQRTLSLILTALRLTHITSAATAYWDYLTKELGVKPDTINYASLIQAYRAAHASTKVAELIRSMDSSHFAPPTFRLGMDTCHNDIKNAHSFQNGCVIFDRMVSALRYPEAYCVESLVALAHRYAATTGYKAWVSNDTKRLQYGAIMTAAVDRVWEPLQILTGRLSYPEEPTRSPEHQLEVQRHQRAIVAKAANTVKMALQKILSEKLVEDPQLVKKFKWRLTVLNQVIERNRLTESEEKKEKRLMSEMDDTLNNTFKPRAKLAALPGPRSKGGSRFPRALQSQLLSLKKELAVGL